MIVNNKNRAVVLCKQSDEIYQIQHYDLKRMVKI